MAKPEEPAPRCHHRYPETRGACTSLSSQRRHRPRTGRAMMRSLLLLALSLSCLLVNAQETSKPTTDKPLPTSTKSCPENRVYNECGTNCPANCTRYDPPPACTKDCKAGCFCLDGYVEDAVHKCVLKEKCLKCTGNTTYTTCESNCPPICGEPEGSVKPCTMQCIIGCTCKPGYVRLGGKDGQCVLRKDCPKKPIKNNT